jgi:hypothetical protein
MLKKHGNIKFKMFAFLVLGLLLLAGLVWSVGGGASVVTAAPIEPMTTVQEFVLPPAQQGDNDNDNDNDNEARAEIPPPNPIEAAEDLRVLREEMTLVQLISQTDPAYAVTACAGNGLNNIAPSADGPKVLIPNAGDLSVEGSNVAIRLDSDGTITFIPRADGQMIRMPMNLGDKVEGQEVLSLTMGEVEQLLAAGRVTWTAKDHGPYGNGHGLAGHIAACDPQYIPFEEDNANDNENDNDNS